MVGLMTKRPATNTGGAKSATSRWRILFMLLVILQLCLVLSMFLSEPESTPSDSHVSPHQLQRQRGGTKQQQQQQRGNDDKGDTQDRSGQQGLVSVVSRNKKDDGDDEFNLDGHLNPTQLLSSSTLPQWIKEYFSWHAEQLRTLTPENWKERRFLILQCVREDPHCGGTSDRLKPIPLLLWAAKQNDRIFLIWWTRPCALEEFLVPNALNWTVPSFLPVSDQKQNGRLILKLHIMIDPAHNDMTMIRTRMQTYHGGSQEFEEKTHTTYETVYHELFRLFFRPSPPISKILQDELSSVHLRPGKYSVAHYRAFYGREGRSEKVIAKVAINSVNCASMLRPGGPVYFASDSTFAAKTVRQYAKKNNYPIVTIQNQEPLHLDKAGNWSTRHPSDFYSIFVDLYLMGMGRCLTYGQGGFGKFGLLVSFNASCTSRHIYKRQLSKCEWTQRTIDR